jgi:signal transduction histidine kinase
MNSRTTRPQSWGAKRLGALLPFVLAVLFLILALVVVRSEWSRLDVIVCVGLFTAAIALASTRPWIALALLLVAPAFQLLQGRQAPDIAAWTLYGAALLVAPLVGIRLNGLRRYVALFVGVIVCGLDAASIVRNGGWGRWTLPNGQPFQTHPLWWEFGTIFLGAFGLFAGAWAAGIVLSSLRLSRRLEATQERLVDKELALRLSEDRARIARDVHDALAHSLAVVVSQADGAAALMHLRPETTEESLNNISSVGRAALIDVRRLVEQIRENDDVVEVRPSASDIEALIGRMRIVGLDITNREYGEPVELAPSQDIAVFRIAQESLTNALKHGGTHSTVTVALTWTEQGLTMRITSSGSRPLVDSKSTGRGAGVEGMKERARLAGGWLTAEAESTGAFVVTAFFPTHETVATARETPQVAEELQ